MKISPETLGATAVVVVYAVLSFAIVQTVLSSDMALKYRVIVFVFWGFAAMNPAAAIWRAVTTRKGIARK